MGDNHREGMGTIGWKTWREVYITAVDKLVGDRVVAVCVTWHEKKRWR